MDKREIAADLPYPTVIRSPFREVNRSEPPAFSAFTTDKAASKNHLTIF
jgi:hypothetical protein